MLTLRFVLLQPFSCHGMLASRVRQGKAAGPEADRRLDDSHAFADACRQVARLAQGEASLL